MMGVGGEDDKLENGSGGGGGFFESFKVTGEAAAEVTGFTSCKSLPLQWEKKVDKLKCVYVNRVSSKDIKPVLTSALRQELFTVLFQAQMFHQEIV